MKIKNSNNNNNNDHKNTAIFTITTNDDNIETVDEKRELSMIYFALPNPSKQSQRPAY